MTRLTITDGPTRMVIETALWRTIVSDQNMGERVSSRFEDLGYILDREPISDEALISEFDALMDTIGQLREDIRRVRQAESGQEIEISASVSELAERADQMVSGIAESAEWWLDRDCAEEVMALRQAAKRLLAEQLAVEAVAS
jgi:hypothetical protein